MKFPNGANIWLDDIVKRDGHSNQVLWNLERNVMKIVISEQPVEIHPMRHMRGYIQIMQQRGTTVNYSANARSGFLFPTSVYTGKQKKRKI